MFFDELVLDLLISCFRTTTGAYASSGRKWWQRAVRKKYQANKIIGISSSNIFVTSKPFIELIPDKIVFLTFSWLRKPFFSLNNKNQCLLRDSKSPIRLSPFCQALIDLQMQLRRKLLDLQVLVHSGHRFSKSIFNQETHTLQREGLGLAYSRSKQKNTGNIIITNVKAN